MRGGSKRKYSRLGRVHEPTISGTQLTDKRIDAEHCGPATLTIAGPLVHTLAGMVQGNRCRRLRHLCASFARYAIEPTAPDSASTSLRFVRGRSRRLRSAAAAASRYLAQRVVS
jgi:hypothetical protein